MLNKETIENLKAELDPERIKSRKAPGGRQVSYLEGYDIINTANRIFSFGEWAITVLDIEAEQAGGKTLYRALVKLDVRGCLPRVDVGISIVKDKGENAESHETAIKGAVTDGMKRCFRHFGDQFGNSLYDKNEKPKRVARNRKKTSSKPAPQRKKVLHPKDAFWGYFYAKKERGESIEREKADEALEKVSGDFEKALILLKEEFGE